MLEAMMLIEMIKNNIDSFSFFDFRDDIIR